MDTEIVIKMIFGVLGGLGIFLLGMKNMSDGMQAVAGNRLRKMINAVTNNRILACGVGTLITCLVQSSSITTVMVVGMVNAGLMNLMQAIGVILGANIGTTITGWILVLKVGKYGLPIIGISALFYLFSKRERVRFTAGFILGLGMIFYGLSLMKTGFAPLKDLPEFAEWFARFRPDTYFGVIKCCLVGAVLTALVQSSSATLGITIGLAATGVIDYPTAAALVLGENIGTTITAYLASLGTSTNAKRAAYAHMLINIIGVLWITAIFQYYTRLVVHIVGTDTTACIAATHTGFNVVNMLVFMPLLGSLSKLLYKLVPDKAVKEKPHLTYLDVRMLETPAIGIEQSQKEILQMADMNRQMLVSLKDIITPGDLDEAKAEKIFNHEKVLDIIQKEISEFLSQLISGQTSHDVALEARGQLRMADEYESISDYAVSVLKLNLKMRDSDLQLTDEGLKEILDLHDHVAEYVEYVRKGVELKNEDILSKAVTQADTITRLVKKYRTNHLERMGFESTSPLKSLIFNDMLTAYRKIKDHALNIAETLAGEK